MTAFVLDYFCNRKQPWKAEKKENVNTLEKQEELCLPYGLGSKEISYGEKEVYGK